MDQQANDCPCKRLRVSEGDEVDQETGVLLQSGANLKEFTEKNDIDVASIGESDKFAFHMDESDVPVFATLKNPCDESLDRYDNSETNRSTTAEVFSNLTNIPRISGAGNQSKNSCDLNHCVEDNSFEVNQSAGSSVKVNQSAGSSESELSGENKSENVGAGPQLQSDKDEADLMYRVPNLHSVDKELKVKTDTNVCPYVKNVQAMAENSYIKNKERNSFQNEVERVKSLESPKLKRTIDRLNTNLVRKRMENLSNSQLKSDSKSHWSCAANPGNGGSFSETASDVSAGCIENTDNTSAGSIVNCGHLDDVQITHGDELCNRNAVSEQNIGVKTDQVISEPDDSLMSDIGRKSNTNSPNQNNNNNVRYVQDNLDDSGFIEMFSNSVMGNVICGSGNGGSYRNSGKLFTGMWKNPGNSCKKGNLEIDKDVKENRTGRIKISASCDAVKEVAPEENDSSEICRFGKQSYMSEDIRQIENRSKTVADCPRVSMKNSNEALGLGLGTSESGRALNKEQSVDEVKNASQVCNVEQRTDSSARSKPEATGIAINIETVTEEMSKKTEVEASGGEDERPNSESKALHHDLDGSAMEVLYSKFKFEPELVNRRFKLSFEQTQEIVSQCNVNSLPITILVQIFKNLTVYELLHQASLVCKYWYNLCRDPDIWRTMCLVNQHRLTDSDLQALLSFSDYRVRDVNLTDCRFVTNQGIRHLVQNCPQIEVLRVMRCFDLTDMAFEGLYSLSLCGNLKALYMDGCCRITDNTVTEVSEACQELRTLHLNQCTRISDKGIIDVARNCQRLTDLQLDHCSQVTDRGISEIVQGCPNMLYLNLMCCGITDTGVKHLAKLSKLTNLDLSNIPRLTSDSIVYTSKFCTNLQCVNVSLNTVIDDHCIAQIAKNLPALERLYCVSCSISDKGLEDIAKYRPTLEALDVGWCQEVTDHGVRVISLACKHLDYFGLIRCDRVTIETIEELVLKYPRINYSTFILESRRLLERARNEGYQFDLTKSHRSVDSFKGSNL